jgi:MtN3 and saliva related transmembrane protein
MTSGIVTAIGGVAAAASTVSFMPQAVKIIRTRDTSSISAGMYVVTVFGFILWTSYGGLLGEWPIIASNGVCLLVSSFILAMKLLPRRKTEKVAEAMEPIVGAEERNPAGLRAG